nr:MAG TPA: hypothetical protein [Crassvirales sp.]
MLNNLIKGRISSILYIAERVMVTCEFESHRPYYEYYNKRKL